MNELILSIETATLAGSICLTRGSELLAETSGDPKVSHSNTLLSEIDQLLRNADLSLDDVQFFAVAAGPGSFTGLRIGIATIKALAETLNKPCVGVPTLEAIAHAAGPSERTLALLPAGRGEVFAQSFSVSASSGTKPLDEAAHLPPLRTLERYKEVRDIMLAGEGASAHLEKFKDWTSQHGLELKDAASTKSGWRVAPIEAKLAFHVSQLALERINAGHVDQPDALQAIYVRPSDAELKKTA